jgi:hypothetical protein
VKRGGKEKGLEADEIRYGRGQEKRRRGEEKRKGH